jgi:cell division topological specificity factor
VNNFFARLTGRRGQTSARTAKERLKFVLVHDRSDISPAVMETLKDEIISTISRHVDIDRDHVAINLTQTNRESRLIADIPLLNSPRKRRG